MSDWFSKLFINDVKGCVDNKGSGGVGPKGDKGDNGSTFTPSVDSEGNLSWTNNGNLENPQTVNIKGPKGDAGGGGSEDVYSIEETVVGTWIDGKPIYRSVINATSTSTTGTTSKLIHSLSDRSIDTVVFIDGFLLGMSDNTGLMIPLNCYCGSSFYVLMSVRNTGIYNAVSSSNMTSRPVQIILEYTKTTDEATVAVASTDELNAAYEEGVQSA